MGQTMINGLALLVEHRVGEVVVLVDDEIKLSTAPFGRLADKIEFVAVTFPRKNLSKKFRWIILSIVAGKEVKRIAAIFLEIVLQNI